MNNNTANNDEEIAFICTKKGFTSDDEKQKYFSYGIQAVTNLCVLKEIDDISLDEGSVMLLAEILTREKASILHFEDIVLDFIS
ncbi:MAG: hypothetical protein RR048_03500 [Oscillospiraceae bacterium]